MGTLMRAGTARRFPLPPPERGQVLWSPPSRHRSILIGRVGQAYAHRRLGLRCLDQRRHREVQSDRFGPADVCISPTGEGNARALRRGLRWLFYRESNACHNRKNRRHNWRTAPPRTETADWSCNRWGVLPGPERQEASPV